MAFYGGEIPNKEYCSFENSDCNSKTSVASKISSGRSASKNSKVSSTKNNARTRSKTLEENYCNDKNLNSSKRIASAGTLFKKANKSETYFKSRPDDVGKNDKKSTQNSEQLKRTRHSADIHNEIPEFQEKLQVHNSSETITKIPGETNINSSIKSKESHNRKASEIPKLKSVESAKNSNNIRPLSPLSKLPIKTDSKSSSKKLKEKVKYPVTEMKPSKPVKKKLTEEERAKEAMKDNFKKLVPLYKKELRKIKDIWRNTIYCTLTMRMNLVKLLSDMFPYLDKTQFNTEGQILLQLVQEANNSTLTESNKIIKMVQTLVTTREKALGDYETLVANKDIAQSYNYDWKDLVRKMSEVMKDIKQLQMETPDLQKKKEAFETAGDEKLRKMELSLAKKNEEIKKLLNQFNILKQRENDCKGNVFLNVDDYKEIKTEVESLETLKKELDKMKANFSYQNELFDKKIKDLEGVLEEKEKALVREKKIKLQLQTVLSNLKDQQKNLTKLMGKEPFEYVMGQTSQDRDRRGRLLWTTSVKLVLKGFFAQMKKLEKDRNRMLLELQLNDSENLKALATAIIQKENFMKSLKDQIKTYYNVSKVLPKRASESACI